MSANEMVEGYIDGSNRDSTRPGDNRSPSYVHGFKNGQDDMNQSPRDRASVLRARARMILGVDPV